MVPSKPSSSSSSCSSSININENNKNLIIRSVLSGGFSLSLSFALVHPLDTIKTKYQTGSIKSLNIYSFNKSLLKSLIRGFNSSIYGACPQGGLRFGTFEYTKHLLNRKNGNKNKNNLINSAIGAITGDIASSIVKVPREVITIQLQTGQCTNTNQLIKKIFEKEGIKGFYRGYLSTALRDIPFMVILFTLYESLKLYNSKLFDESSLFSCLSGGISGSIAGYLTTPADIIKTNIMANIYSHPLSSHSISSINNNKSILSVFNELYNKGGIIGLFRGSIPRTIFWGTVTALFFPTYEYSKTLIHSYQYRDKDQKSVNTIPSLSFSSPLHSSSSQLTSEWNEFNRVNRNCFGRLTRFIQQIGAKY